MNKETEGTKELSDRKVNITGNIDQAQAERVIKQLLKLNNEDSTRDIQVIINSQGGNVLSALSIMDVMELIESDVSTIVMGWAGSMAAIIQASGTKGKRFALPHSEIMIHQPSLPGIEQSMKATDMDVFTSHILQTKRKMAQILSIKSNHGYERVLRDIENDYWLTADEAVAYGLVDEVLTNLKGIN